MQVDTDSCSVSARGEQITVLFRAAILSGGDALGELCEALRPSIFYRCRCYLATWRVESYAEDVTQDVLLEVVEAFPRIAPYNGNLLGLVRTITLNTLYAFMKRNRVLLRSVSLPDNEDAEDQEYRADPLDGLSREAWERDSPPTPVSMANKYKGRRLGRAATAKKKARAKEREQQAKPGSGNYRRDPRRITAWELKRVGKERTAFAEA